jgi:replicative DNA helicase
MIRALAMQQKLRTGLGLVVVDFLQRIKPDTVSRSESRERDVAEIAQGLAELAKELNVPVLCPSAINRAMVAGHRKPTAADLRESGMIESEAHMVIMLHRPEVTQSAADEEPSDPEILVVKHRGGPIGTVPCRFTGASQRWEALEARF